MTSERFHEGELAVQRRAGVRDEATRLEGMLAHRPLSLGAALFLARTTLAVLTARDGSGRLWTSPLAGPPGFLTPQAETLEIGTAPGPDDPLRDLPAGQDVGLIAVDFAHRRRFRVNGRLVRAGSDGLLLTARQAFGNCPSYIQRREVSATAGHHPAPEATPAVPSGASCAAPPSAEEEGIVTRADTFFLGTTNTHGADTSHKGGPAGFVRSEGSSLWWPDYAGNNLFNSMGNLVLDPTASLLFLDFTAGTALHLSGRAEVEWLAAGSPGDDGDTGRRIRFHPEQAVSRATGLRASGPVEYSPHTPALSA